MIDPSKPYQELNAEDYPFLSLVKEHLASIDFTLPEDYKPQTDYAVTPEALVEMMGRKSKFAERNFLYRPYEETARIEKTVSKFFGVPTRLSGNGHWYPPGGFLGWHTNEGRPGWRMYMSHADEAGQSFFRYRDPTTHEIITSYDSDWQLRVFRITKENPLWHCVWSNTNRFSMGCNLDFDSLPNVA